MRFLPLPEATTSLSVFKTRRKISRLGVTGSSLALVSTTLDEQLPTKKSPVNKTHRKLELIARRYPLTSNLCNPVATSRADTAYDHLSQSSLAACSRSSHRWLYNPVARKQSSKSSHVIRRSPDTNSLTNTKSHLKNSAAAPHKFLPWTMPLEVFKLPPQIGAPPKPVILVRTVRSNAINDSLFIIERIIVNTNVRVVRDMDTNTRSNNKQYTGYL